METVFIVKTVIFFGIIGYLIYGNLKYDPGRKKPFRLLADLRLRLLKPAEKIDYAGVLHNAGRSEESVRVLTDVVSALALPAAYERRAHIYNEMGLEAEAIADLDEAIRLDPEPYLAWYTRAIVHNDRGELGMAARDFQEALKRRDDSKASTHYELGNVYMKLQEFGKAESSYTMAVRQPEWAIPHFYYRHSAALWALDREEEALDAIRHAVALQDKWSKLPDRGEALIKQRTHYSNAAVHSFLNGADEEFGYRLQESRLLERLNRTEEALATVDRALRQYSHSSELQLRKGALLRGINRFAEAEQWINGIKDRNPLWIPAYMELCTTYRLQEKMDDAVRILEEAKQHFPDNTVIRYWLADAYRDAGKPGEAMEENRSLTNVEPEDPLNWKQRGELAIDADRYGEAEEAYSKALELDDKADYYMRRSFVRYMDDRFEDAMLDIQAAVERDGSLLQESRTSYAMGELYVGMENWELAEAEYSRAMALEPDNPQIYDRRARCRYASDKLTEAIEDCDRGIALDPKNAKLLWLRSFISFRLNDFEAAMADSLAYTRMQPDDSQGFFNLGLVYKELDRYDDALHSFSRAIELNPFDPQAYLERAKVLYHYLFDRARAADDLAEWLLYAGGEKPESDRLALLADLSGFDDELRERAMEKFRHTFESPRYLS